MCVCCGARVAKMLLLGLEWARSSLNAILFLEEQAKAQGTTVGQTWRRVGNCRLAVCQVSAAFRAPPERMSGGHHA